MIVIRGAWGGLRAIVLDLAMPRRNNSMDRQDYPDDSTSVEWEIGM